MNTFQKADRIVQAGIRAAKTSTGRCYIEEITLCTAGYAEPGYTDPESGVIAFGNWNKVTRYDPETREFVTLDTAPQRVGDLLQRIGVELEWSDEWYTCDDCGKAVRCQPDSYGWQASYWFHEGCGVYCHECVKKDPEEYLEAFEGKSKSCITIEGIDPADHGYTLLEGGFENGWHGGQNADPKVIAKSLRALGVNRFLFRLDSVGQFDLEFSVYVHNDEITDTLTHGWAAAQKDGPDMVQALQRSLQQASEKMAQLPADARIKVAKCNPDGTADVKVVSPQDFVDGKALD